MGRHMYNEEQQITSFSYMDHNVTQCNLVIWGPWKHLMIKIGLSCVQPILSPISMYMSDIKNQTFDVQRTYSRGMSSVCQHL